MDFVSFERRFVVEIDGGQHAEAESQDYDMQRTTWLESQGFRVLRLLEQRGLDQP
jgi:adenine-specific DNA-methyltransferase